MPRDRIIMNKIMLAGVSAALYFIYTLIDQKIIKKEDVSSNEMKLFIKRALMVASSVFSATYVLDYISPSSIEHVKPGVIISDPEF